MLRQRKVPKRKAILEACPALSVRDSLRFSLIRALAELAICRACRLANPAQTGRLAYSRSGCDARLHLQASILSTWLSVEELPSAISSRHSGASRAQQLSTRQVHEMSPQTPSGAAEHHREYRIKLAPCLSVFERSEIASCASARFDEKRRVSGHENARQATGSPFFWVLSLWQARESTSPKGAKSIIKCPGKINLPPGTASP